MISLSRIGIREIELPLKEPFRTAQSVTTVRRVLLIESVDSDGVLSWSECVAEAAKGYSDETVDSCWTVISEGIAPGIVDRDFPSVQAVHAFLQGEWPGNRMARAAVEMGVWNLEALSKEQSLASLLSAGRGEPRRTVTAGIAIGIQDSPAALVDKCRKAVAEGYRRIKIKISPQQDIEIVSFARDAVPPGIDLSVDGNRSYSFTDDDIASLVWLDELGLAMIEQPLRDHAENAKLQKAIATPVCLDESIRDVADVDRMVQIGSGRIVNLKPGRVGGFTESIAIHDKCVEHSIPLWCGGMNETGIGRAYNVALASLPGFTLPGDLSPSSRYWIEDIVIPEWTMDAYGSVDVPVQRPGIGVDVDVARIDRLTVREAVITSR